MELKEKNHTDMNWYLKYKQAKALPESTTPYPKIQPLGLETVDKSLEQKNIEEIFGKQPTEFLGSGFYGGAWSYQGKVKKITKDSLANVEVISFSYSLSRL